jgi:excisionase family DNA binding protein
VSELPFRLAVVEAPRLRLALTPMELAEALGVSRDFVDEHVLPELRVIRRGRKVLVAVSEVERWLSASSALTLEER